LIQRKFELDVTSMPLIQKIIQVGDSRAITIPKSWLEYYERKNGHRIKEVSVEVNGKLIIKPILEDKIIGVFSQAV
jgi:antitoxin component of MazEF toxin-antitoxin module